MIVGIMSDTHGQHLMTRRALAIFDRVGVTEIIHCGDVCGREVFEELAGRAVHFVWGNCDLPNGVTRALLDTLGMTEPNGVPLRFVLDGKRFVVYHGHEREALNMGNLDDVDYVCHGHTHQRRDERVGPLRIINPGALHRAFPRTVATLDTESDRLIYHIVDHDR
jgi:hypothetical protein